MIKKIISWGLALWIAFVFVQSLFFKFTNAPDTQYIFGTIGAWMAGNFLQPLANLFTLYGGYTIGAFELLASILLILPRYRPLGALLALALMTGAIFFHLFTPLGINVQGDGGILFYMACSVWVAAIILLVLDRGLRRSAF